MSRFEVIEAGANEVGTLTYVVADHNEWSIHYVSFRSDGYVQLKSWHMDDEDHTMPSLRRCDISESTAWDVMGFLECDDIEVPELLRGGWHEMGSELVHHGWWEFCPVKFAQRLAQPFSEA